MRAQSDPATATPGASPTPTPTAAPLTGWQYAYYTYDAAHPHAVATIARGSGPDTFGYDAMGGMTAREEGSETWTQGFDEEGRLETLDDGTNDWVFAYDGDGVRVMQENPDGTRTLFLGGGAYEVHIDGETETVTRHYGVAGQRVMIDSSGTYYLLTDHLGSVVAVTDSSGTLESEQRYLPFGGERFSIGITETDFGFTGQRNLAAVGLMDYNARWYSPMIGRFTSADTIVPGAGNPQAMNRYSYVSGNPLRFSDPTGHYFCEDEEGICKPNKLHTYNSDQLWEYILEPYGVELIGDWSKRDRRALLTAVKDVASMLAAGRGYSYTEAFTMTFSDVAFVWQLPNYPGLTGECAGITFGGCTSSAHLINFATLWGDAPNRDATLTDLLNRNNIVHELGHAFANLWYQSDGSYNASGPYLSIPQVLVNEAGWPVGPEGAEHLWRQGMTTTDHEVFADMFLLIVYDVNGSPPVGTMRYEFMDLEMPSWLDEIYVR